MAKEAYAKVEAKAQEDERKIEVILDSVSQILTRDIIDHVDVFTKIFQNKFWKLF